MLVQHILADKGRDVFTIGPEFSLAEAVRLLATRRIGALVVVDTTGAIAGVLSERDIVRALAEHGSQALEQTVSAHMTTEVEICGETDAVEDLMETMTHCRLRHLPVLNDGHLVGIVSIGDVVKIRIAETVREAASLREYISAA